MAVTSDNPAGWPNEVMPVFERFITCEAATLTKVGKPITWPLIHYLSEDRRTIDVSTGLAYPAKAERARRDPRVSLLFSDPTGSGLASQPTVLVLGHATVHDADLQANADRYLRETVAKVPAAYKGQSRMFLRAQAWYFSRIWIAVTPLQIMWWPSGSGDLDRPPSVWEAPAGTVAPPSDPAPVGPGPGPWQTEPGDWHVAASHAVKDLGDPVITVVGEGGFPVPFRTRGAALHADGFLLKVPPAMPAPVSGPACLTFHRHPKSFTGQENVVFTGEVEATEAGAYFRVEKLLPDFSLPGNMLRRGLAFMGAGRKLAPRLESEAARRGQQVPKVRFPGKS